MKEGDINNRLPITAPDLFQAVRQTVMRHCRSHRQVCRESMIGDACLPQNSRRFLINLHEASAYDFLTLIKLVQTAVYAKSGIWLECEIIQITPNTTFG